MACIPLTVHCSDAKLHHYLHRAYERDGWEYLTAEHVPIDLLQILSRKLDPNNVIVIRFVHDYGYYPEDPSVRELAKYTPNITFLMRSDIPGISMAEIASVMYKVPVRNRSKQQIVEYILDAARQSHDLETVCALESLQ